MMEITIQSAKEITVKIPEQTSTPRVIDNSQEYEADSKDNNHSDYCGGWVRDNRKRRRTNNNNNAHSSSEISSTTEEDLGSDTIAIQQGIPIVVDTWPEVTEDNYASWNETEELTECSYEKTIEELLSLYTVAWEYSYEELEDIFKFSIKEKWVIANQLITREGSRCTFSCDTENHHVHTYCKAYQRNLLPRTLIHNCTIGLLPEQIHLDIQENYLENNP